MIRKILIRDRRKRIRKISKGRINEIRSGYGIIENDMRKNGRNEKGGNRIDVNMKGRNVNSLREKGWKGK